MSEDVDLSVISRGTPGFSGADLANLVNEAALWAARQGRKTVIMEDFEMSKDKVLMGVESKSMILSMKRKSANRVSRSGPRARRDDDAGNRSVHKVTIIPRGMALGVTLQFRLTIAIHTRRNISRRDLRSPWADALPRKLSSAT